MQQEELSELLGFKRSQGVLYLDRLSSLDLIKEFGSPLLVLSPRRLIDNYESIFNAFKKQFTKLNIAYAFKANYLPSVCSLLAAKGAGAEVMTGMELFLATQSAFKPEKIVFNGPAKSFNEILQAIRAEVGLLNAESLEELSELAEKKWPNTPKLVGIRISPKMSKEVRKNALVRPDSKLGLDAERAFKAAKKYGKNANFPFGAVSIHVGCRNPPGLDVFENSLRKLASFSRRLEKELGIELSVVDIGGGFPPRYKLEQTGHSIEAFADIANDHLAILRSSPTLVVEPGRYLVGDAMVGLGSVVRRKKSSGQSWLLLDIGVNVLIPLGFANYDIVPCQFRTPEKERVSIGGPLCQPNDEFIRDASLNLLQGDVVAIFNAGAYTLSMAGQFGYPRPGIVKVDQGKSKLIRRSESFEAVWEGLEQI